MYLTVALGGALGACARFGIARAIGRSFSQTGFPVGTFTANVIGCFLLGIVYVLGRQGWVAESHRLFWATGVMGALTTFSTFSVEGILLLETGRWKLALTYWAVSLVSGILMAFLGMQLAEKLTGSV